MATVIIALLALALVAEPGGKRSAARQAIPAVVTPQAQPQAQPAPVASGPNLLTPEQVGFRPGVGHWTGTNAVLAWTSVASPSAADALKVTAVRSAAAGVSSGGDRATWTPAVPGQFYYGSISALAGTTSRPTEPVLVFRSADGTPRSTVWGQATPDSTTGWAQTAPAVGIAPAGTSYVELAAVLWSTVKGEIHYLDAPTLTTTPSGGTAVNGPLRTDGNHILDANGRQVVLRGLQRYGLEADGDNPNFDKNDIMRAKQWGANLIRISLGEEHWLAGGCGYDPSYASKVDSIVSWVTQMGMVALIDLHFNTIVPCSKPGLQKMADAPNAITFWRQVAQRYGSNPLVAFDLYNEPHDISDAVWRNGGPAQDGGVSFVAAGMQQLYDVVRSEAPTNLVFVSGNQWATQFPSTAPLSGYNIVYAVHAYTCPQQAPHNCTSPDPYDPPQLLDSWVGPSERFPVVITEFGWPDPKDGRYDANVIRYADAHGWGWVVFAWDGSTSGQFDLLADAGPGASYEPSPAGMPVIEGLQGR